MRTSNHKEREDQKYEQRKIRKIGQEDSLFLRKLFLKCLHDLHTIRHALK